jgi:hypothetical protein
VAQVFNLCTRTGKIPVPPKTFQVRDKKKGRGCGLPPPPADCP